LSKRKKGRDNEAPLNRNKRRREEKATQRKEKNAIKSFASCQKEK
jgi:hypothetical protein